MKKIYIILAVLWLASCGSGGTGSETTTGTVDTALVGDWRILSETLYLDSGLTSPVEVVEVTTLLVLDSGGGWQFGSSSGTWNVADIETADWNGWGVDPAAYLYTPTPTRKLNLNNWSNSTGKGPVEEQAGGTVDYIWAIYSYTSDTMGPGTMWIKFGHN